MPLFTTLSQSARFLVSRRPSAALRVAAVSLCLLLGGQAAGLVQAEVNTTGASSPALDPATYTGWSSIQAGGALAANGTRSNVTAFVGGSAGARFVRLGAVANQTVNCTGPYEPNDTWQQAKTISVGATQSHDFCARGDQDWGTFTITTAATYRLETQQLARGVDTRMILYAAGSLSTPLATDDDSGDEVFASAIERSLTAGTYYVRLEYVDNFRGGPGYTYQLHLTQR